MSALLLEADISENPRNVGLGPEANMRVWRTGVADDSLVRRTSRGRCLPDHRRHRQGQRGTWPRVDKERARWALTGHMWDSLRTTRDSGRWPRPYHPCRTWCAVAPSRLARDKDPSRCV